MSAFFKGPITIYGSDFASIRSIFLQEGFSDPSPLQTVKPGQVFGLIKKYGQVHELHVRMYDDGSLDSEVELSRDYLEHPHDCRPMYGPIIDLLIRHSVSFAQNRPIPPDPVQVGVPNKLTAWKPLAVGAGIIAAGSLLAWLATRKDDNDEDD